MRMGIVGTGNIAPLNVAGYLAHPQCDVVAVCDAYEQIPELQPMRLEFADSLDDLGAVAVLAELSAWHRLVADRWRCDQYRPSRTSYLVGLPRLGIDRATQSAVHLIS